MPGDFYDKDKLIADKGTFVNQINSNTQAIADLTAENVQLTTNVDNIDSILAVIDAGYPVTPALGTITGFAATQTALDTVDLEWDTLTDADGYVVRQATIPDFSDAVEIYNGASLTCTASGLTNGITYYFDILGYAAGFNDSPAATTSAVMNSQLQTPLNFILSFAGGGTQVVGNWDTVLGAENYQVYRNTGSDNPNTATLLDTVAITTFTDGTIVSGTSYWYYLYALGTGYLRSNYTAGSAVAP